LVSGDHGQALALGEDPVGAAVGGDLSGLAEYDRDDPGVADQGER